MLKRELDDLLDNEYFFEDIHLAISRLPED
jgi:hypothetical protein